MTAGDMTGAGVRPSRRRIARFDKTERVVHWCNATLFLTLIATGAALYAGPVSQLVGRRELVRTIHVYSGLLLPVPILVGIALHSGRQLRDDLGRLSRWDRDDRIWWRKAKRASAQLGKFNPGQKLNATFLGAAIVVMLATGSIMRWFEPFPIDWRTGATFVHDWFALGVGLAIFGHILLAFSDPDALRGIVRGWVPAQWAKSKRPRWYAETSCGELTPAQPAPTEGQVGQ
jgi:formate dehydrogenase subunit gamma